MEKEGGERTGKTTKDGWVRWVGSSESVTTTQRILDFSLNLPKKQFFPIKRKIFYYCTIILAVTLCKVTLWTPAETVILATVLPYPKCPIKWLQLPGNFFKGISGYFSEKFEKFFRETNSSDRCWVYFTQNDQKVTKLGCIRICSHSSCLHHNIL